MHLSLYEFSLLFMHGHLLSEVFLTGVGSPSIFTLRLSVLLLLLLRLLEPLAESWLEVGRTDLGGMLVVVNMMITIRECAVARGFCHFSG